MTGNESVRFCHSCKLNVYNISQFSDSEAEEIFAQNLNGNRMCTRLYRRPDGTIMTDNCPRALRRLRDLRNKTFSAIAKVAALATLFLTAFMPHASAKDHDKAKAPQPSKAKSPVVSPSASSPQQSLTAGVPMMPDISSYMQQLETQLRQTWKKAGHSKQSAKNQVSPTVRFSIDHNGVISKLRVTKSSNQAALDQDALNTVQSSSPFAPPPPNCGPVEVEFTFDYESNKQSKEKFDGH